MTEGQKIVTAPIAETTSESSGATPHTPEAAPQAPEDPRIAEIRSATAAILAAKGNPQPWPPFRKEISLGRKIMDLLGFGNGDYLALITQGDITKTDAFQSLLPEAQAAIIAALNTIK
jgi:hypothetical protein